MNYNKKDIDKLSEIEIYKLVLQGRVIKTFPNDFWKQSNSLEISKTLTKYLIEDILQLSNEDIKTKFNRKLLRDNKLGGMLLICFNSNHFKALDNAYPNLFKEWEFGSVSHGFWEDNNNCINAIKWLIEDELKWSDEEVKLNLSKKTFKENNLGNLFKNYFNGSPFQAIELAYPGKFQPWELNTSPQGYWNDINNGIKATKWLIEDKLKLTDKQLKEQLSIKLFENNGLRGMLAQCFNCSPYDAINSLYQNKFQPWEFKCVSQSYWKNDDNKRKAIKWLIEDKYMFSDEELKQKLSLKLFVDNGLNSLITVHFNNNKFKAIDFAYPGKFKKSDFKERVF